MRVRHTVIFTFYKATTKEQIKEVISRLEAMGKYLQKEVGVTDWVIARHIPETFNNRRAHLLQDGIFPSLEALGLHANSEEHKLVVELTSKVSDWMTIDTIISE